MKPNNPPQRVFVIINPAAGQKQPILHTINAVFFEAGITWDVFVTRGTDDTGPAAIRAAVTAFEPDVVAVYGGDGTVMEMANILHGTDVPLAILPGGTANVLAADLTIPNALNEAVELIIDPTARLRPVDMGRIGDQLFFHLSLGFLGEVAHKTDRAKKDQSGRLAYFLNGIKELQQAPAAIRFGLELDGEALEIDGISCMVTNFSQTGIANVQLSKDIDISDGFIDVLVIRDISLPTVITALTGAITSGEFGDAFWHRRVQTVSIAVDPSTSMMLDGEPMKPPAGNFTVEVVPGALQIIVPDA